MKSLVRYSYIILLVLVSAMTPFLGAQTYRGGIAGTVEDSTGAAVPNARIRLVGEDTGFTREMDATSSGVYSFQDLQIGNYSVIVTAAGFGTTKIDHIAVRPGQVFALDPKLNVNSTSESVEVNASTVALDTLSSTNNAVVGEKAVANIPLNGRSFTQLLTLVPGYNASGSLNGARSNQLNYQIDGADNNDIWQGSNAANQGGVGPIAGVTLPIEAIDQFSVQSSGNAEEGHSAGGLVSMSLKTGTNSFHGSAYFYGRSEFFAARDFFALSNARKQKVRNQQFGGSIGGPIIKDKLFFFGNYERQVYNIQLSSSSATEPGAAYVTQATQLLQRHGISGVNPLSMNLLTALWPGGNAAGLVANTSNYVETHQRHGYSDNVVGNLNYILSPKQTIRLQAFIGTGRQAEPGGPTYWYFQVAPDITQNFSLAHNWTPTEHLSNQLLIATGIFNQTFNDLRHDFNMPALGLNTGVTTPSLFGAPTITMTGFDGTGATQPLGRKDFTGHIVDSATWIHGAHQIRFGGEFRRSYIDLQYQSGVRGNFSFTGYSYIGQPAANKPAGSSAWSSSSTQAVICKGETVCGGVDDSAALGTHTEVLALADFLMGYYNTAGFTNGNLRRDLYRTDMSFFIQDQYKVLPKLVLNFGLRHEFFGNLTTTGPWSVWRPGAAGTDANGLMQVGTPGTPGTYKPGKLQFSPRVGFNFTPTDKLAVRGSYGLYFDSAPFNGFGNNSVSFATGANATGLQANPFGGVGNVSLGVGQWQTNQPVFANATGASTYGLFSVDPNLKTAYSHTFNLATEYQLTNKTVVTLAYAGSTGVHLYILRDVNQAAPGTGVTASALLPRRPCYLSKCVANYQSIGAVVQVSSNAASNYNSLQATIKTGGYHGLTGQLAWTYAHSLDNGSGFRSTGPTDSNNLALDYGNATFDIRHTLTGYVVWEAPQFAHALPVLTKGWQVTVNSSFHTPTPFSLTVGDNTGIGMNKDRANYNGGNFKTGSKTIQTDSTGRKYIQFWSAAAQNSVFTTPVFGSHGNTARDQFRGFNFFTFDTALAKNTQIHEGVSLLLRAEMFNLFNFNNAANPPTTLSSNTFGQSTSAPTGISAGAPFNVQFAAKLLF